MPMSTAQKKTNLNSTILITVYKWLEYKWNKYINWSYCYSK